MFEVDTEELIYLTHNGVALEARIYKPRGEGPFPAMVDAHGGAWILGTYKNNDSINRRIASGGIVIMAIDFTLPPDGTYPSSVQDTNYAIRWLKKNATRFNTKPEWVGAMGTSAGGHLAVLAAMKPHDPRYSALPLEAGNGIDAESACIIAEWPVICPATRWKDNQARRDSGADQYAHRVGGGIEQMKYWLTEEAMADGSPMLALERGDKVSKPPLLYVQANCDNLHPKPGMDRFCANYNKLGGTAEALMIEGEPYDFLRSQPESAEAKRAIKRMIDFIHENTDKRRAR